MHLTGVLPQSDLAFDPGSSVDASRPLPGWGQTLRGLPRRTGRTAVVLAAAAGFMLTGCQSTSPVTTTAVESAVQGVLSQPVTLRGALVVAMRHLDVLPRPASHPFHLVAFKGKALDEAGSTIAAAESEWVFSFSRYEGAAVTPRYEVVEVAVPGTGYTTIRARWSEDQSLSPIENWDAGLDATTPDSVDLLAPFKAAGVSTKGSALTLSKGVITIEAGGKSMTYNTVNGTFVGKP